MVNEISQNTLHIIILTDVIFTKYSCYLCDCYVLTRVLKLESDQTDNLVKNQISDQIDYVFRLKKIQITCDDNFDLILT